MCVREVVTEVHNLCIREFVTVVHNLYIRKSVSVKHNLCVSENWLRQSIGYYSQSLTNLDVSHIRTLKSIPDKNRTVLYDNKYNNVSCLSAE